VLTHYCNQTLDAAQVGFLLKNVQNSHDVFPRIVSMG